MVARPQTPTSRAQQRLLANLGTRGVRGGDRQIAPRGFDLGTSRLDRAAVVDHGVGEGELLFERGLGGDPAFGVGAVEAIAADQALDLLPWVSNDEPEAVAVGHHPAFDELDGVEDDNSINLATQECPYGYDNGRVGQGVELNEGGE